jgi:hypothetical protein
MLVSVGGGTWGRRVVPDTRQAQVFEWLFKLIQRGIAMSADNFFLSGVDN